MQRDEQRRLGAEGWRELLTKFADSGLTARAFCAQEKISIWSFNRWRSRLGAGARSQRPDKPRPAASGGFVSLGTLGESSVPTQRFELTLELGAGLTLHLVRG